MTDRENKIERIVCAAIHYDDKAEHTHQPINIKTGVVICGMRHHNCFYTLYALTKTNAPDKKFYSKTMQGFLTSHNRYVSRNEAFKIAMENGQIENLHGRKELYSEDLY